MSRFERRLARYGLSRRDIERAMSFGGIDFSDLTQEELLTYFDKGGHRLRSMYHSRQHRRFWRRRRRR